MDVSASMICLKTARTRRIKLVRGTGVAGVIHEFRASPAVASGIQKGKEAKLTRNCTLKVYSSAPYGVLSVSKYGVSCEVCTCIQ